MANNGTSYKIITIAIIPALFFMGKAMYDEGAKWRDGDKEITTKVEAKIDKTSEKIDKLQETINDVKVLMAKLR